MPLDFVDRHAARAFDEVPRRVGCLFKYIEVVERQVQPVRPGVQRSDEGALARLSRAGDNDRGHRTEGLVQGRVNVPRQQYLFIH